MAIRTTILLSILALTAASAAMAGDTPKPWDLGVRIVYGEDPGPESLRDYLETVAIDEIRSRECFRSVRKVENDLRDDSLLVLKVRIDQVRQATEHDVTLGQIYSADHPDEKKLFDYTIEVDGQVGLLASGTDVAILDRGYSFRATRRPTMLHDDPSRYLLTRLLDNFADSMGDFVCKGSEAKLRKQIEQTRRDAPAAR